VRGKRIIWGGAGARLRHEREQVEGVARAVVLDGGVLGALRIEEGRERRVNATAWDLRIGGLRVKTGERDGGEGTPHLWVEEQRGVPVWFHAHNVVTGHVHGRDHHVGVAR
jgi:hypothetical protein